MVVYSFQNQTTIVFIFRQNKKYVLVNPSINNEGFKTPRY